MSRVTVRKPNGLADEADVDARLAVLGLKNDDVAGLVQCDVGSASLCGVWPEPDFPEEGEEDPAEFLTRSARKRKTTPSDGKVKF